MPKNEKPEDAVDWDLTTWEGSRRETLRRWARLPLERVIAALEEMQELSEALSESHSSGEAESQPVAGGGVQEQRSEYGLGTGESLNKPENKDGNSN